MEPATLVVCLRPGRFASLPCISFTHSIAPDSKSLQLACRNGRLLSGYCPATSSISTTGKGGGPLDEVILDNLAVRHTHDSIGDMEIAIVMTDHDQRLALRL